MSAALLAGANAADPTSESGREGSGEATPALPRNIARLHEECPGADRSLAWLPNGDSVPASRLNDGNALLPVDVPLRAVALGIEWPIAHVIDAAFLIFADETPDASAMKLEVHDGRRWRPIPRVLRGPRQVAHRRLALGFEPIATRAFRVRFAEGAPPAKLTEIEVNRYMPSGPKVWPNRLVASNQLDREILASGEEPSFESLSLVALPMTPARALLGLKDAPHEIGAAWDGTLLSADTLTFSVGEEGRRLHDVRDTVRRFLVDGWRPGVVVEGRIGDLALRETALVCPVGDNDSQGALWVRVELENLSERPIRTWVEAKLTGRRASALRFRDGCLVRDDHVVLLSQLPCKAGATPGCLRVEMAIEPRQALSANMVYFDEPSTPAALAACRSSSFDRATADFRQYWDQLLASRARIEVPEARVNRLYRAVLAQIFINGDGDFMYYGSAPSVYERNVYGVEEFYCMQALAWGGFGRDAQRYMDATYLTPEFLKKVEPYRPAARHQQYRNGLQPHYAVNLYRLTRDRSWIAKHVPLLKVCAEWTIAQRRKTMILEDGKKPPYWGLLPKWAYGGDIAKLQCYPLYPNFCCWRGLVDTAWLLEELGDGETARRYADEARQYREVLDRAVETLYRKDAHPPWLPLRLDADRLDEGDFYQLFAGCLLDVAPFDPRGKRARYITDFLEADNRTFCLLPRFRGYGGVAGLDATHDVGAGGLDGIYGLGYVLTKLHADAIPEFLLGFYGYLALNMDHETFAARETNLIYASDLHLRASYTMPPLSDPLPCASAVALHYLRNMLVTEELNTRGDPSGNLLLLAGAPRRWFRDGRSIRLSDLPTQYGPISLEVASHADDGRIEATLWSPRRNSCRWMKLRLRHPEGRAFRDVTVNEKPWSNVEPAGSWILLPPAKDPYRIVAGYQ